MTKKNIKGLLMGRFKNVLSEFRKSINNYDSIIEQAQEEQEAIRISLKDIRDGEVKAPNKFMKKEYDYDIKACHVRILQAQKAKDQLLKDRGQYGQTQEKLDREEALRISLQSFLILSSKVLTDKQFEKLRDAIETNLIGKTIPELQEFVKNKNEMSDKSSKVTEKDTKK